MRSTVIKAHYIGIEIVQVLCFVSHFALHGDLLLEGLQVADIVVQDISSGDDTNNLRRNQEP